MANSENRVAVVRNRVAALTQLMKERGINYYIVPSEDAHQSEYISYADKRREYISGFTGSAGLALVSVTGEGRLWTDGRYYTQAEKELDLENWQLMKTDGPSVSAWLGTVANDNTVVAVDPKLISVSTARAYESAIKPKGGEIQYLMENLVDAIWKDKDTPKPSPVIVLSEKYSGRSVQDKLEAVRAEMRETGVDFLIVSALDEIAWLLNIRGTGDIAFNPVVISYAIVRADGVDLFIDENKLTDEAHQHFKACNVSVHPYEKFFDTLKEVASQNKKVWIDSAKANYAMYTAFSSDQVVDKPSPIQFMKAIKNEVELAGMRWCHIKDGAAQADFFSWLEEELEKGTELTEHLVAEVQEACRAKQADFMGLSFETISGVGSNAAIIHYRPTPENPVKLVKEKIYLNDSGAQYMDGTTDVTRTFHFGTPSEREMDAYTRVLKGFIALSRAVFPKGKDGYCLDVLARQYLWQAGLDYNHGTGHGVGHFLNVHEWPARIGCISNARDRAMYPLQPNIVMSNEPGYYEPGAFGIRIENLVVVKQVDTPNNFNGVPYYGFEQLTMVPIQTRMIKLDMMTNDEIEWLNAYHQDVWTKVSPLLKDNERALKWLKENTKPITK